MNFKSWLVFSGVLLAVANGAPRPFAEVAAEANAAGFAAHLPDYERTPEAIGATTRSALDAANQAIDQLSRQDLAKTTFDSTFAALDRIKSEVGRVSQRFLLLQNVHTEAPVRDAAGDAQVEVNNWAVGLEYREDVYRVLEGFAKRRTQLEPEQARLMEEVLRDYRRAGLALPAEERAEVERLRKELNEVQNEFQRNIAQAQAPLLFTAEELAGVPESFLASPGVKQDDGRYQVMANITWHALAISENCRVSETRRRVALARGQLAKEANVPVLTRMVQLRTDLARRLGYATWADYQIEAQMAENGKTAVDFEEALVRGLDQKFAEEKEQLRRLKVAETGDNDAQVESWDVNYYQTQLKSQRFAIDVEELRNYFPYGPTLEGMFRVYERIFGLTFAEVEAPDRWVDDLQLYYVTDTQTGRPVGMFYLDMFPREGKYNHFACFPILNGGPLPDGRYELPLVSLVCNFPPPSPEQPSLLKHDDVITLFHEFGHVMHALLGRSRYDQLSSFNVPRDFVEAPSQMLENWVWDKAVLDTFAADYRDPTRKVPAETIAALEEARQATAATFYRRQLSFGLLDLALHTVRTDDPAPDVVALTNEVLERVSYPPIDDTAFAAYFGHLAGYDAGYYGYLWALAIATDLASVFEQAPGGYLDEAVGRKLRDEIYAPAATRDASESIERFLGRKRSLVPFLRYVGVDEAEPAPAP